MVNWMLVGFGRFWTAIKEPTDLNWMLKFSVRSDPIITGYPIIVSQFKLDRSVSSRSIDFLHTPSTYLSRQHLKTQVLSAYSTRPKPQNKGSDARLLTSSSPQYLGSRSLTHLSSPPQCPLKHCPQIENIKTPYLPNTSDSYDYGSIALPTRLHDSNERLTHSKHAISIYKQCMQLTSKYQRWTN